MNHKNPSVNLWRPLKKLSQYCQFATNFDDSLRDQVVYGIKDNNIKKRLLLEDNLSFKKSVEMCLSMEAANNNVSSWEKQEEVNYQRSGGFTEGGDRCTNPP